jgi:hypothetical protein
MCQLVLEAKNMRHWSRRCPSTPGWNHIEARFHELSNTPYSRRQMSNKWGDLKNSYFNWRTALLKKSGLGRDPVTGDVVYDPVLTGSMSREVLP